MLSISLTWQCAEIEEEIAESSEADDEAEDTRSFRCLPEVHRRTGSSLTQQAYKARALIVLQTMKQLEIKVNESIGNK